MKRVYTAEFLPQVAHVQNLLAQAGVSGQLRNERLSGAAGDIPFLEAWPELWVADEDESRAQRLIATFAAPAPASAWTCAGCGEAVEGQFTDCWNCGAPRPAGEGA